MNFENVCLVMTGCIAPPMQVSHLHVRDKEIRKKQYIEAMRFYISGTRFLNIVFCDNSDAIIDNNIVALAKKYNKNFEWLNFEGDYKKTEEKGKGYGEGEILSYVIGNSILLKKCEFMAKVTGRLILQNIGFIMKMLPRQWDICCNSYIDKYGRSFMDTRFFVMKVKVYQQLFENAYKKVNDNDGFYLEHSYAETIRENNLVYHVFPIALNMKGISGSNGMNYFTPKKALIGHSIDLFIRCIMNREKKERQISELDEELVVDDKIWNKYFLKLEKKKIIIYGAGYIGNKFYKLCERHCKVVAWVDSNYSNIDRIGKRHILSPCIIKDRKFDFVVIAVKSECGKEQIRKNIINMGVLENKIVEAILR